MNRETSFIGILNRIPRWALALVVGIAPAIITLLLIGFYLKSSLFDFRPAFWNDQTYNWHQAWTFSHVGFNGGYYMFYERLPVWESFRFGASGFLFPAIYGALGRVFGWEMYTGILFNMAGIALGTWAVIYVAKFNRLQILLTGLFTLSVWPVLLSMPTIMQESVHQVAGLVLVAIFYRLLRGEQSRGWFVFGFVFLVTISLIRFSWVLLFLPFFILSLKKWTWPRIVGAFVASGVMAVVIVMVFQNTSAPGNSSIFARVGLLSSSPLAGLEAIWKAVLFNLETMLRIDTIYRVDVGHFEFVQIFVLLFGLLLGGQLFLSGESQPKIAFAPTKEWFFHLYNLISILGASLVFYLSGGYYRVFAPYLLLSGILLIAFKHYRMAIILIVIGLLGAGTFLRIYSEFGANFFDYTPEEIEQLQAPYDQYLAYDPQADAWCNTVLVPVAFLDNRSTFVPPGMGISFFVTVGEQPIPVRSAYLMLDGLSYEVLHRQVNLRYLADIPGGKLYRNMDVDCSAS